MVYSFKESVKVWFLTTPWDIHLSLWTWWSGRVGGWWWLFPRSNSITDKPVTFFPLTLGSGSCWYHPLEIILFISIPSTTTFDWVRWVLWWTHSPEQSVIFPEGFLRNSPKPGPPVCASQTTVRNSSGDCRPLHLRFFLFLPQQLNQNLSFPFILYGPPSSKERLWCWLATHFASMHQRK